VAAFGGLWRATARGALLRPSARRRRALLGPTQSAGQRIGGGPPVDAVGDPQQHPVWPAQFRRFFSGSALPLLSPRGGCSQGGGPNGGLRPPPGRRPISSPRFQAVGAAWTLDWEVALERAAGKTARGPTPTCCYCTLVVAVSVKTALSTVCAGSTSSSQVTFRLFRQQVYLDKIVLARTWNPGKIIIGLA